MEVPDGVMIVGMSYSARAGARALGQSKYKGITKSMWI